MSKKNIYILISILLAVFQANAQFSPSGTNQNKNQMGATSREEDEESTPGGKKEEKNKEKKKVPSVIKTWSVSDQGALLKPSELDTSLIFYHNYMPVFKESFSNTFTGNNGGAYISNDYFSRNYQSDFYFNRSYNAYLIAPSKIQYLNTTTPYSTLDYSQSENRLEHNETRFNVLFSQNVNKNLNFEFILNSTKSTGQYMFQENKFRNVGVVASYSIDKFISHSNILFNRIQGQENGGLGTLSNGDLPLLNETLTDNLAVRMDDASHKIQNTNFFTVNEYRLGKTIKSKADTGNVEIVTFIPKVGFIYQFEYSNNKRSFTKSDANDFFENNYTNSSSTNDSVRYSRLSNIFQIKFYESPDRKFTFGKRIYIGNDQLHYNMSDTINPYPDQYFNSYVGGGIFRNEGRFWQWDASGKIYLTGYRAGQTELTGFINKPIRIKRDTTTLNISGSLKTIVPEYFDNYFYSNHFQWSNNFNQINEMIIRSSIRSQEFRTTIGVNYSLIGNYIYNNEKALPDQAENELLILSGYLNKDFGGRHWLIRTQLLGQTTNNENIIHLPTFSGYVSINYRILVAKVLHTQFGVDTRYNTAFYADAYEPSTARFYLQNEQKIGNYPYVDIHANLKLKRTRFFFLFMNSTSGLLDNYYVAPAYPYYQRTFRFGLCWSFYD